MERRRGGREEGITRVQSDLIGKLARLVSAALTCMVTLSGCGSRKHNEGIAELRRVESAIREMRIVVSAGTNQQEFSRRLTDSLIKIGDLQQSLIRTTGMFPEKDKPTVAEAYQHLAKATDAYTKSKDFLGGELTEESYRYESLRKEFPNLAEIKEVVRFQGEVYYSRADMVQGLWKVAAEEIDRAKALIDQLAQG